MSIRLSKMTRVLDVGLRVLVDFLHVEGYNDIKEDLNQILTDEQYNILQAAFCQDESIKNASLRFLAERQIDDIIQSSSSKITIKKSPSKSPGVSSEICKGIVKRRTEIGADENKKGEVFKIITPQITGLNIKIVGKIDIDAINASDKRKGNKTGVESVDVDRIKEAKKGVERIAQETIERKESEERERKEKEERERKEKEERERQILIREKEIEQKRNEIEKRLNENKEKVLEYERIRREKRLEQERKEREERERRIILERERLRRMMGEDLYHVSHNMKSNASSYIEYLKTNRINHLYHFTDRRNLQSIKDRGGLFSWKYCVDNNIEIPFPGGGEESRSLDLRHGLSDYVRLSFCTEHPMAYVLRSIKNYDIIILRVKIDVVGLEGTLFSDINATDNNHHHGGTIEDLKRINLDATQQEYVGRSSEFFKQHQAEVMVKTFIPLEYIFIQDIYTPKFIFPY